MQDPETFDPAAYVAAAAPLVGLTLTPAEQARIAAEFALFLAIARPALARALPPTEPAAVFRA
jgi:hypothetical protein